MPRPKYLGNTTTSRQYPLKAGIERVKRFVMCNRMYGGCNDISLHPSRNAPIEPVPGDVYHHMLLIDLKIYQPSNKFHLSLYILTFSSPFLSTQAPSPILTPGVLAVQV